MEHEGRQILESHPAMHGSRGDSLSCRMIPAPPCSLAIKGEEANHRFAKGVSDLK
jgi:hypothetical protein